MQTQDKMTPPKNCVDCPVFKISLFQNLSTEQLKLLEETKVPVHFKTKEKIIRQGNKNSDVFCMFSGLAKVYSDDASNREHIMTVASRGDAVGVITAIDGKTSRISFEVLNESEACRVPGTTIQTLMSDNTFTKSIIQYLLSILYRHINPTRRGARFSVKERMARVLVDFAKKFGEQTANGVKIMVPLSRKELASLAETVNETAVRTLGELKNDGLITTKAHDIYINDMKKLEELTNCPKESA